MSKHVLLNYVIARGKSGLRAHRMERRRREPLGGLGACPRRKFSNLEVRKCYFQCSPRAICNLCVSRITSYTVSAKQCRSLKEVFYLSCISLLLNCLSFLRGKCHFEQVFSFRASVFAGGCPSQRNW